MDKSKRIFCMLFTIIILFQLKTYGFSENIINNNNSIQSNKSLTKQCIDQAKTYEAQGLYGNALVSFLKAKQYKQFELIIDSKINAVKRKLNDLEISYSVIVSPFNNYSNDPEITSLISSNLTKILLDKYKFEIKMGRSVDESFNSNASLIITGDIHSCTISEDKDIREKTVKYQSGTERIEKKEYTEISEEKMEKCLAYEREKEIATRRKDNAGLDLAVGGLKYLTGVGDWKENLISGGAKIGANAIFSSEDEYKRECEGLKEKRSSMNKYEEIPIYSFYTYRETMVKKQGKIRISVRLIEKGSNKVFYNQTLEDYINDSDITRPEFIEAGIKGDPLNILSDFELREKIIESIVEKATIALEDSLESYKPNYLIKKAKEYKINGDNKKAVEYFIRALQSEKLESKDLNESVSYLNSQGNINLSSSTWKILLSE